MSETEKSTKSGFTKEERDAMKERAKELKANATKEQAEKDLLEKIAELPDADRELAERVHAIVREHAPDLDPKTWYGMPAYNKDGKAVVFFQGAGKFKARYSTLGFNDGALLDDGAMWPTSYALTEITDAVEKQIIALVKKAAG